MARYELSDDLKDELFQLIDEELVSRQGHPKTVASAGREHVYDCPVCGHAGKLTVNPEKGVFNCWSCGGENGNTRGGLVWLAKLIDIDPDELMGQLLSDDEIMARLRAPTVQSLVESPVSLDQILVSDETMIPAPPKSVALDATSYGYLRGRNISDAEIAHYRLFMAEANGAKRIMFPDFNAQGQLRYWQGRLYLPQHMNRRDKYAAPDRELVPRNSKMFNWHRAIAHNYPYLILCEGPLDAIAAGPMGVAQWGKDWTQEQLALLVRAKRMVLVAYDGDAWQQTQKMAAILQSFRIDARPVPLPVGEDPLSYGRVRFYEVLKSVLGGTQNDLTLLERAVLSIE